MEVKFKNEVRREEAEIGDIIELFDGTRALVVAEDEPKKKYYSKRLVLLVDSARPLMRLSPRRGDFSKQIHPTEYKILKELEPGEYKILASIDQWDIIIDRVIDDDK